MCFEEDARGGGGGDIEGERARRLRSVRSLPGDLRMDLDEKTGEGERRIRGGEGVAGARFLLWGDRDLRLRGDLLRDLQTKKEFYTVLLK